MNSRVSWNVDGIDPSVRERAEAAARRAGMSLNDWLNSTIGESAPPNFRAPPEQRPTMPSQESRDVADIHQRLDSITRQIDQISKPAARNDQPRGEGRRGEASGEPSVARQLNDAISRLDARLSQISSPAPVRQAQMQDKQRQNEMVERAAAQVYRPSPPLSPNSFDLAIAEIAARQNELDGPTPRQMPRNAPQTAPSTPPMPPVAPPPAAPAGPDFSSLERHLIKITSQIEALQRPDHVEQSIAAFRSELAEIRAAITEAMPRRAIELIENEIRSLSRRIDDTRQSGSDVQMLAGIERALGEIREALRSLTPAEQLTGYDEAIRNLGAKLDLILRSNDDPSTVHQLEGAIAALRSIVSNVASNDALARLSDDVQMLSAKVDQLARSDEHSDSFAVLEQRIAALASTLESRQPPPVSDNSEYLEGALRSLSERLDRIPVGNDNAAAFAHLEQRVTYLLERLETSGNPRSGDFGRVEEGLQDILRHLERQHANLVSLADTTRNFSAPAPQPAMDPGLVEAVKRELSDIRYSQSETDRRTQDSLETVHNTLGHVVDRLAMIEGDLRAVRAAPPAPQPMAPPALDLFEPPAEEPRAAMPFSAPPPLRHRHRRHRRPLRRRRNPNCRTPLRKSILPQRRANSMPRSNRQSRSSRRCRARSAKFSSRTPQRRAPRSRRSCRPIIRWSRAHGRSGGCLRRRSASQLPKARSAKFLRARKSRSVRRASSPLRAAPPRPPPPRPPTRRPARAAAKAAAAKEKAGDKTKAADAAPSTVTSKIRSLLVGASVVVIVLGTFKMAMTLLDTGSAPQLPPMENSSEPAPAAQAPADNSAQPAMPAPVAPSMTSPTPIGRQSNNTSAPNTLDSTQIAIPQVAAAPITTSDITGAIPTAPANGKLTMVQVPSTERLPDGIGGPVLRAAALKGDPTAAYEVGLRFAEGKGIAPNFDEAAKWYDRAAQAGVVPAIFRLGTFYEKGMSVKKDVDIARRYYLQAAERGNAKAMHNLAVLDADGGGKGANYKSASQWFRKAADRGVADSQFNLGILYARGIGVEQNLAESFKWFSLAASQGDADSGRKRDDIAKRLDAQSLAAAKLAIQTFTTEPQPDDAVNVASPQGGWDSALVPAVATKPAARPAPAKRITAAAH